MMVTSESKGFGRHYMRRWIIGFGLLVVSLIYGQVVFAHANLERSEPAPNSVLPEPPQEIRLWFSEPLEAEFSSITIRDSAGNTLETPASELDPNDSYQMVIRPGDVADGIYTISWRALSAADGHGTLGNFPITIGAAEATSASNIPAADTIQPDNVAIRWLNLTSLSMLVGAVGFLLFVWQPAITEDIANIEGQMRRLMWVAWVLVGISGIFALALQISIATGEPLFQNLDLQTISLLVTQTRYGTLWLVRMILWVGVGGALVFARGDRWFYWIALIIGMGILLTQSLHSHASAAPDIIPAVANDWLHLFSTALWIGGLIQFINVLFALRGNTSTAISSQLVGYFSNFARIAVLALIVSGIYAAWLHVGSVEGLLTTLYGQALLIKILLILPLLALAGINLVFTHQGLHAGREIWNKRLRGLVGAEITLAAALMLAVGVMTSIAPARSALAARSAIPLRISTSI
jgi:copper transport protein